MTNHVTKRSNIRISSAIQKGLQERDFLRTGARKRDGFDSTVPINLQANSKKLVKQKGGKKDMRKYIRYARTQANQQPDIAVDVTSQLNEITDYAHKHHLRIINTLTDSGSVRASNRRGFEEMLGYINNGAANGILCLGLDRLSRDFETSYLLYKLIRNGLEIITPHQIYNKDTDERILLLGLRMMGPAHDKTHTKYVGRAIKRGIRAKKKNHKKGGESK